MKNPTEAARHLPYDVAIEQALLGSLFVKNENIDTAAAEITAEHFYDPFHGRLFDMIVFLSSEGEVTPMLVNALMKADPGLIELGGAAYLFTLAQASPSSPNVTRAAAVLRELAYRRSLIEIGEGLVNDAYDNPHDSPARGLADQATEELLRVGSGGSKPMVSVYDTAMETVAEVERMRHAEAVPGITSGLDKLDRELGCLRGGDLVTIIAKSGMGKSALMGGISLRAALAGFPVKVFSLEMTRRQWVERMVCDLDFDTAEKAMWYSRARNGRLNDDELARFMMTARKLDGLPIEIDDEDGLSMQQISARSRAFIAKHPKKMGLIVTDYFQIVEPADFKMNREQQVSGIARGHKSLAKRTSWVVMGGSQMNEDDQKRTRGEQRPRASDVRESKSIMNESDQMLSPYRPAVAVLNRKPMEVDAQHPDMVAWRAEMAKVNHVMDLLCLKNRHGRVFDLNLFCNMGASAIRDRDPTLLEPEVETAQGELLEGY